jgi:hypothetical protein
MVVRQNKHHVCSHCYAARYEKLRPSVSYRYRQNGLILSEIILSDEDIPIINAKHVRLNSYGELMNKRHYENLIKIVNHYPDTYFTLWTKRLELLEAGDNKPKNLQIIYSNPRLDDIMTSIPLGCDGVFNVVSKIPENSDLFICKGKKCMECLRCYRGGYIGAIIEKVK